VSRLVGYDRLCGTGALSWRPRNGAQVAELALRERRGGGLEACDVHQGTYVPRSPGRIAN